MEADITLMIDQDSEQRYSILTAYKRSWTERERLPSLAQRDLYSFQEVKEKMRGIFNSANLLWGPKSYLLLPGTGRRTDLEQEQINELETMIQEQNRLI